MSRSLALALSVALVATLGCRKRELTSTSVAARASASAGTPRGHAVVLASAKDPTRLPEDPAAGQRSVAQWREHLEEEERERQLNYDKRKLKEHGALIAVLKTARDGYDNARDEKAVSSKQRAFSAARSNVQQRLEKIDRWGVNSKLLKDYASLIELLSEAYPAARIAALGGEPARLDALRVEFDTRVKKMTEWLESAEEAEEE